MAEAELASARARGADVKLLKAAEEAVQIARLDCESDTREAQWALEEQERGELRDATTGESWQEIRAACSRNAALPELQGAEIAATLRNIGVTTSPYSTSLKPYQAWTQVGYSIVLSLHLPPPSRPSSPRGMITLAHLSLHSPLFLCASPLTRLNARLW